MQTFTNKFTVVLNQDKTEAIINFYQESPALSNLSGPLEGPIPTEFSPVANLVMTGQCAHNLLTALQEVLNAPHPNTTED